MLEAQESHRKLSRTVELCGDFTQEAIVMKFESTEKHIKDAWCHKKETKITQQKEDKILNEVHMVENRVRKHQERGLFSKVRKISMLS